MKINGNPDGGGGGSAVIEGLSITSNGTYTAGAGVDGYSPVEVDVPIPSFVTEPLSVTSNGSYAPGQGVDGFSQVSVNVQPELQNKTVVENGEYIADQGYYGLGTVTVSVPSPQFVTESLNVTVNGTYAPGQGVDGYSQVVVDVPQSVTGFTEKDLTENFHQTITSLNNSASFVGEDAFEDAHNLQTVNLPQCEIVYSNAFKNCYSLTSINLPICNQIFDSGFMICRILQTVNLPQCKNIRGYAFVSCFSLSQIDLPECNVISGYNAFASCSLLQSINLPNCYIIGETTFLNDNNLTYLNIPKLICNTSNANNINLPVYNLYSINLPLFRYCGSQFYNLGWGSKCLNLSKINLPVYTSKLSVCNFFYGNYPALNEISIGNKTYIVPSFYNVTVMSSFIDDFTNNSGIINVDAAMYDKWVSASGWSSLSSFFSVTGDPNIPMLSIDENNTLYGKTELLEDLWYSYVTNPTTITSIYLPSCKIVDRGLYLRTTNYSSLLHIDLPECIAINGGMDLNYRIETLNLPKCEALINFDFGEHRNMTMILGNSSVCTCLSSNGSIAGGIGRYSFIKSILVPTSLVDAYKSTIPWTYYSDKIFPIE